MAWTVALVLVALVWAGCGTEDRQGRARTVAEGYFQAVKANDLDQAVAFFAPRYLETRSPAGLKQDFRIITARLGELRSYRLTAARAWSDFVPPDSGTHVLLEYEVEYARHPARETFTIHKPFGRREYKILNHTIVSQGFFKE